ncbi:MAG: helix-turn-helix transcriptional regulator [Solidesulfovibrio sp. DCME]|uniref:helix-turn-helix transcriptional regulator n=1 Tax=Solidesulfovibrio sp. DCME TaxID=3447380 RepID=UPI003D1053C7
MSSSYIIPETGFLRFKDVQRLFPVSKTVWYDGIAAGRYPAPVRLAPRCVGWRVEDIRSLISNIGAAGVADERC